MLKVVIKKIVWIHLLLAMIVAAGCGGGSSTAGSPLTLTLSKTTLAAGTDILNASVTLTSSGAPVNGVRVRIESNKPWIIPNSSEYALDGTSTGTKNIPIQANYYNEDADVNVRVVSVNKDASDSAWIPVKVIAPKLTCSIPAEITPPTWNSNFAFIGKTITSNYQLKFVDGNGNPISNQVISLYIDSLTNKDVNDQIVYTPVQGSMIIAPPGVFTGTTDSSGVIIIPMYIQMALAQPSPCSTDPATGVFKCTGKALSIMTANWRAVAQIGGQAITTTGSSLITFTNTGV